MTETKKKTVYVCHCIDVEGPMEEKVEDTWVRLTEEDGIELSCEASAENLRKLQDMTLEDPALPADKAEFLAGKYSQANLGYLKNWDEIDEAFDKIISNEFRTRHQDSTGGPYRFNWFIYDHFGFTNNPRYHAVGAHAIWDHYHELFLNENKHEDGIYWHYHPVAPSGDAVEWHINWFTTNFHEDILARRIIERNWFPSVFRAGGHIERNCVSYWLECFIPFDYSCRTPKRLAKPRERGSVNDWRGAPMTWGYYHPHFYDYRRPGIMKRSLYRCLDLRTWITAITEEDVDEAFEQADLGYDTVLAYYNHDYRDMADDIDFVHDMINTVAAKYPEVEWKYVNCMEASTAMQRIPAKDRAPKFTWTLENNLLTIESDSDIFGPEPFLAIQENGRFFRDATTQETPRKWCYYFRRPHEVEAFGIAANSPGGKMGITVHQGPITDL